MIETVQNLDVEVIYALVMAWLPAIAAVVSAIIAFVKQVSKLKELKGTLEVNSNVKKEIQEIRDQQKVIVNENIKLRKQLGDLITEMSKVNYEVQDE